jgi:YD repeat-containing protein
VKSLIYDNAGRNLGVQYADGTILTLQYDPANRLTTMIDWGGTTTMAYTNRNELAGKTDPDGPTQAYQYDSVGNRGLLVNPDGGLLTTTYDGLNRAAALVDPTGRQYTAIYDTNGRTTMTQDGIGNVRKLQYDDVGRVVTLIQVNPAGAPIATIVDTYDPGGRKTASNKNGAPTTYLYDNANRLIGQQKTGAYATFAYDPAGNILVKWQEGQAPLSMTYDVANRLVTGIQGALMTTFTYDPDGNKTLDNAGGVATGYVYDCENRLKKVTYSDGTISTYSYGGDGLRRTDDLGWERLSWRGELRWLWRWFIRTSAGSSCTRRAAVWRQPIFRTRSAR